MKSLRVRLLVALICTLAYGAMFAATQIDLTTQVRGILPFGNGGTGQSSFSAGVVRSNGTALSSAELSGDVSTSGSNSVTVSKVNGTSVPTNSTADQLLITTAAATGGWRDLCTGSLNYSTSTHLFTCGGAAATFVDGETPTGTCPTTALTLAHSPSPTASLMLYKNGQQLIQGASDDFTLSGANITLTSSCGASDKLRANYRY
jgi:hypothetical protein